MKAIVRRKYGSPDVLQLEETEKPTPADDEVLIEIRAASVNAADWHFLRGKPYFLRFMVGAPLRPKIKILGADIAGRVEDVGRNVQSFQPGDEVFGDISECGWGGFAEYVCASENALAPMPAGTGFEEAADVPLAAITALQAIRDKGKLQPGQRVLINGASGGVGTFAIQIAKSFGAEVTAVCSTRNLDIARSIGADHVIDYTRDDFARNGQLYDLIVAANGDRSALDYRRALKPGGICVVTGGTMAQMFQAALLAPWISMTGGQKMRNSEAKPNREDLALMSELMEAGRIVAVIDRRDGLSEVPEAIRYLEEGHAQGKIVVTA